MSTRIVRTDSLRAMNGDVRILGVNITTADLAQAMDRASMQATRWDQLFSRFVPESTLCQLNASAGTPMIVDRVFLDVLSFAVDAARVSGGLFDPSILPALESAGYDRSFELIGGRSKSPGTALSVPRFAWSDIEIDRNRESVRLPLGMRIDLGGIAKGAYVDAMAEQLRDWPGGYIEAGGDLAVWGVPPSDDAWIVGIEDPFSPSEDVATLTLAGSVAVATSGTYRRRWTNDHETRHHLIDPRTGMPVTSSIVSVTTVATTTALAEIGAKELLIGDVSGAIDLPRGCEQAVMVDNWRNVRIIKSEVARVAAS